MLPVAEDPEGKAERIWEDLQIQKCRELEASSYPLRGQS